MRFSGSFIVGVAACSAWGCASKAVSDSPGETEKVSGVNVCSVTVSGGPDGDETFEMREAPEDELADWQHLALSDWSENDGSFRCAFRDPIGEKGNYFDRFSIYASAIEGRPPVSLEENGEGYDTISIDYHTEPGIRGWSCLGMRHDPVGDISVNLTSMTANIPNRKGLYARALLEGSFEATCPSNYESSSTLAPVTIRGSWTIVEGSL